MGRREAWRQYFCAAITSVGEVRVYPSGEHPDNVEVHEKWLSLADMELAAEMADGALACESERFGEGEITPEEAAIKASWAEAGKRLDERLRKEAGK